MSMTPHFWNKLDIKPNEFIKDYDHDSMAAVMYYDVMLEAMVFVLNRTRARPFSFQLRLLPNHHVEGEVEDINEMLKMLVERSEWWVDASIGLSLPQASIQGCAKNRLQLVRSVQLLGLNSDREAYPFHGVLGNTPRLTHVGLGFISDVGVDYSRLLVLQLHQIACHEQLLSVLPRQSSSRSSQFTTASLT